MKNIKLSMIAVAMMNGNNRLRVPVAPKEFFCEEKSMAFEEKNIKKLAKEYNLKYTLDYLNATVVFVEKA